MSPFRTYVLAGLGVLASISAASAAQRSQIPATSFYSLYQAPEIFSAHRQVAPMKVPHNGFDLRGDGVHPPIGPITD